MQPENDSIDYDVFIFGSGFSNAITNSAFPTLSNLTSETLKLIEEDKEVNEDLKNLLKNFIKENDILNFEDLLTLLYQDFPWKKSEETSMLYSLYILICNQTEKLFLKKIKGHEFKKNKKKLTKNSREKNPDTQLLYDTLDNDLVNFIKKLHDKKVKIITFNYDNFFEEIALIVLDTLYKKEFINNYRRYYINQEDFYLMPLMRIYRFVEVGEERKNIIPKYIKTFTLNKLHGSFNWFYYGKNPSQIYLSSGFNVEIEKYAKEPLIPLIIPPVYDKSSIIDMESTRYLWIRARNFLSKARRIYILGYSLPDSDLSVRLMFKNCINKNAKIFIIDKDAVKIRIAKGEEKTEKFRLKWKYLDLLGKEDRIDCSYIQDDPQIIFKFMKEYAGINQS